jgi:hypothetical protein
LMLYTTLLGVTKIAISWVQGRSYISNMKSMDINVHAMLGSGNALILHNTLIDKILYKLLEVGPMEDLFNPLISGSYR